MRIGLLSDTHGYLDAHVFKHFKDCDEVWHAGDFGNADLVKSLQEFKPLRGVYGNIDGQEIRKIFPETLFFKCAGLSVLMTHIGGYPGRYAPGIRAEIQRLRPGLFISGHSHILKVMYDKQESCLHMNPGAAGKQGWHKVQTLLRFSVENSQVKDLELIELGGGKGNPNLEHI